MCLQPFPVDRRIGNLSHLCVFWPLLVFSICSLWGKVAICSFRNNCDFSVILLYIKPILTIHQNTILPGYTIL